MKKLPSLLILPLFAAGCSLFAQKQGVNRPLDDVPPATATFDFGETYVSPDVYAVVASRTTNKMLDATSVLYRNKSDKPKLYIADIVKVDDNIPEGFHYAQKVMTGIIEGSRNFLVVDNVEDADYQLNSYVSFLADPTSPSPIVEYRMQLTDENDELVDEWAETLRQLKNDDRSWW